MKLKVIAVFFVLTSLLFINACSKKSDKELKEQQRIEKERSMIPEIKTIALEPSKPIITDVLRALPQLENPRMRGVKFTCTWFVNGDDVSGEESTILPSKYLKKGDDVYCKMIAVSGRYQSKEFKSKKIQIQNAPPVINHPPIPHFQIPGQFQYNIDAEDPDGDTLSYKLLLPLDKGIELDSKSGMITWDIREIPRDPEAPVNEYDSPQDEKKSDSSQSKPRKESTEKDFLTSTVTITFEVSDSDGAKSIDAITINLDRGAEIPR